MEISASDALHFAVSAVGVLVTIAVLKTDISWLKKWANEHQARDDKQFDEIRNRRDHRGEHFR